MTILRVINCAGNLHSYAAVEPCGLIVRQDVAVQAQPAGHFRQIRFLMEGLRSSADHQQTLLYEPEIADICRELFIAGSAGKMEVSEQRRGSLHVRTVGGPAEPQRPADQLPVRPEAKMKRAFQI